ncbi:hypothetical protein ACJX0J_038655, partial [Zea mays]
EEEDTHFYLRWIHVCIYTYTSLKSAQFYRKTNNTYYKINMLYDNTDLIKWAIIDRTCTCSCIGNAVHFTGDCNSRSSEPATSGTAEQGDKLFVPSVVFGNIYFSIRKYCFRAKHKQLVIFLQT